jgi:hypothetical protein
LLYLNDGLRSTESSPQNTAPTGFHPGVPSGAMFVCFEYGKAVRVADANTFVVLIVAFLKEAFFTFSVGLPTAVRHAIADSTVKPIGL